MGVNRLFLTLPLLLHVLIVVEMVTRTGIHQTPHDVTERTHGARYVTLCPVRQRLVYVQQGVLVYVQQCVQYNKTGVHKNGFTVLHERGRRKRRRHT